MKLFQPNNLSRHKPEFTSVDDVQLLSSVASALMSYQLPLGAIGLSRVEGANVVSDNFRLDLGGQQYFLKRRQLDQLAKLTRETLLTGQLRDLGVKAPQVIPNGHGALVTQTESHAYVLSEFVEGNYFSGHGTQLESASEAFAAIARAAKQLDWNNEPFGHEFLARLPSLLDLNTTDGPTRDLMREHQQKILNELETVKTEATLLESTVRPLHLDFHPLNLLIRDSKVVCVLDFEHLKPYPTHAAVGFAGFKLIREILTDPAQQSSGESLGERWLEGVGEVSDVPLTLATLRVGAAYRILFLIDFILDSSLRRGDGRFIFDLEKQILSLYELESLNWV